MAKHTKVRVDQISIDPRFQRELDMARANSMSKNIDLDRIGVPVVSRRIDGTVVALDGQHRVSALNMAGRGAQFVLCEVHEGLSLIDEAALFLKLNGGRKAVRVYDKFRAQIVAKVPVALEIQKIVHNAGLRITKAPGRNCVCAIQALEFVHCKRKNLAEVLCTLKAWADDEPGLYEGKLIKGVSEFLCAYPAADRKSLAFKLKKFAPERVLARIDRTTSKVDKVPFRDAAAIVLREIYNHRAKVKLLPLHRVREDQAA